MFVLNEGQYTGNIVNVAQVAGSIITHTHYSAQKSSPDWHYHQNLHICFVFQGGKSETKKRTLYTQPKGSIFFYHPEEVHRWVSPQPISKSANIEISDDFLKTYHLSPAGIQIALQKNVDARALILKMQCEILLNTTQHHTTLLMLLLELVNLPDKLKSNDMPKWVMLTTELLQDRWNEHLSLGQIATQVGVHPVTISKHFRKYFHCTFGEYQRKLKIDKSIELIKNSELTLSEIAHYCGFVDQSHFIKNFKEKTGFLPKHFQQF
ncbi:hypothetical protein BKI52_18410 [marine bacterium AO1-C]|nr:hypothetical protein BKI52_18410 [marine bacterium AO1-C]